MQQSTQELAYWLALWRIPGVGPKTFFKLAAAFARLSDVFSASPRVLAEQQLSQAIIDSLKKPDWQAVEQDLKWAEQPNHAIISWLDPHYPKSLKEIAAPPPLIYLQGDPKCLAKPQLAMVGSRNPTLVGIDTAQQFAFRLTEAGLLITSGLALGIDAACHQGALAAGGATLAIVGTGLDRVYPAKHKQLAQQITTQGALLSEFPLGTPAKAGHFPRRNRLISGMSHGVLVVEASLRSGSLITARYALEQGKEIFAIPGSIHSPLARGCHWLIRQGAKLVEQASDIIEELANVLPQISHIPSSQPALPVTTYETLDADYIKVLNALDYSATTIDSLVARTQLSAQSLSSMLLILEINGQVVATPGGYMRI